jgi:hypothetical protein
MRREFDLLPSRQAGWVRQIRNHAVVPAGEAERVVRPWRDEPIAGIARGVPAQKSLLTGRGKRRPPIIWREALVASGAMAFQALDPATIRLAEPPLFGR